MIKIVLNDKKILLVSDYRVVTTSLKEGVVISFDPEIARIQELIDELLISEATYLIIEGEEEILLERVKSAFVHIMAGGGLVINQKGEYLFINRHKKWDLPKGKLEPEEEMAVCAMREVCEETGLEVLSILEKLLVTYHLYIEDQVYLKETHWYLMSTSDNQLTPQREEGIEKALWVHRNNIAHVLNKTYVSVKDVCTVAGIWDSKEGNG